MNVQTTENLANSVKRNEPIPEDGDAVVTVVRAEPGLPEYWCGECQREFKNAGGYSSHMRKHAKEQAPVVAVSANSGSSVEISVSGDDGLLESAKAVLRRIVGQDSREANRVIAEAWLRKHDPTFMRVDEVAAQD